MVFEVAGLTLEQKVSITTGLGYNGGRCNGNIAPVGTFPGLCLEGSSTGVSDADFVTAFPAPINAATTWVLALVIRRFHLSSRF